MLATVPAGFKESTFNETTSGNKKACAITLCEISRDHVAKRGLSTAFTLALSETLTVYGVAVPHACSEVSVAPPEDEVKYAVIGAPANVIIEPAVRFTAAFQSSPNFGSLSFEYPAKVWSLIVP